MSSWKLCRQVSAGVGSHMKTLTQDGQRKAPRLAEV